MACPQWHCRAWVRAWSSPVPAARIWPPVRGSGWRRCLTRARRKGGSTRWPAWSRSRSARSPRPGTTGSPRSGSGSGGPARRTWPGCAPRGTRSPAGTGRRMRRRSGSCWTAWTRGPWPGPCSGRARAAAGAPAGRPRPACAATVPGARPRQAKALARGRLRAVAVDGKTSRGARRADGTRVHLLGVAEHGGRLLDHLEVGRQAQRDQPLHRAPGAPGPGRRRGDLRRPPHGAGEPGLAGQGQESPLHRGREAEPAAAARPGQGAALAAGTGAAAPPARPGTAAPRPAP